MCSFPESRLCARKSAPSSSAARMATVMYPAPVMMPITMLQNMNTVSIGSLIAVRKRTIESAAEEWAQAQEEEAEEAEEKSDVGYKSPRIEIEPCEFISEYPLNVRDGRRAFLADLSKWRACPEKPETEARYFWRFEDETEILVEQKKAFEKSIGDEESATVADFYYVRLSAFGEWIATSKIQLERWLGEKYSERPAQEN